MPLVTSNVDCTNGEQLRFATMALTGDGHVDFVMTDGCDLQGVGEERWISHATVCE